MLVKGFCLAQTSQKLSLVKRYLKKYIERRIESARHSVAREALHVTAESGHEDLLYYSLWTVRDAHRVTCDALHLILLFVVRIVLCHEDVY